MELRMNPGLLHWATSLANFLNSYFKTRSWWVTKFPRLRSDLQFSCLSFPRWVTVLQHCMQLNEIYEPIIIWRVEQAERKSRMFCYSRKMCVSSFVLMKILRAYTTNKNHTSLMLLPHNSLSKITNNLVTWTWNP